MKSWAVFFKVGSVLEYLRKRKRTALYQQWMEKSNLGREAIPPEEITRSIILKIDKERLRLPVLYIFLGVSLGILCVGLILLAVHSC